MKFRFLLRESVQALRGNMLRSLLTIVGIVVGIFSVTAMLALGQGLSGNILDRFNSFTAGDITVAGSLTQTDLAWIKNQSYVSAALGSQSIQNAKVIALGSEFSPSIQMSLGDYTSVKTLTMVSGAIFDFNDAAFKDRVVLVDQGFVAAVLAETGRDVSTGSITLNGKEFTIVGVFEGGAGGFGRRNDGTVIVPYAAAVGVLTNTTTFSSIGIRLKDTQYFEAAGKHILESLNVSRAAEKDSEDYFSVTTAQDAIKTAQETTSMISIFLGIVGGIALFVGGIGTMNMMLTTVTERTREIGLRKAIGARDSDILLQILLEAVMLTIIGGAIGIILTYGASNIANRILTADSIISVVMSGSVVAYATGIAIVVGIVFGLYPAQRASKLQPVDALRAE